MSRTKTTRREFVQRSAATGAGLALARTPLALAEHNDFVATTPPMHPATTEAAWTRGVGEYPGDPAEYFGPTLQPAGRELRNLALYRPAYASSAYDYNLTAQLVTDGLIDAEPPRWFAASVDGRELLKHERELLVDHFPPHTLDLGSHPVVEVHLGGGEAAPTVDRLVVFVAVARTVPLNKLAARVATSSDGRTWQEQGTVLAPEPLPERGFPPEFARDHHLLALSFPFAQAVQASFYRIELTDAPGVHLPGDMQWKLGQVEFYASNRRVQVGGPYSFTSAWKSASLGEEWVYVDLGAVAEVTRVTLHWIAPAVEGALEVSNDGHTWRGIHALGGGGTREDVKLLPTTRARYVRARLLRPATSAGYVLSEMEVWGSGGVVPHPHQTSLAESEGHVALSGGRWRLARAENLSSNGPELSRAGYDDHAWLPATVPGTVLTSYLNAGAVPDPNFGANQLHISDSYFYADFWFRTEFPALAASAGELLRLNFTGVNWKAEVFLNGEALGRLEGGFTRAHFEITGKLRRDAGNALAVRVLRNATPGSAKQKTLDSSGKNGGALGADNPTFHASVGWDWIPTIRGRNTGLWGEVALRRTTTVALADPLVQTHLVASEGTRAEVSVSAVLTNHAHEAATGTLRGRLGSVAIEQPVTLQAGESKAVRFTPRSHPQLTLANPQLWWPNGYGEPYLHEAELRFHPDKGEPSRPLRFQAGLREMTWSEETGALRLFINGRRFVIKGGNWGFAESMLRYRAREYDAAVRYHREMNFNTVRNWVGQVPDDAFYEACDRYGIIVWQDFWLANPWDGPDPADERLFMNNAEDMVRRIRRHPCIGLYCGRNEGFPPASLDHALRELLRDAHPGMPYISSSADGAVSGHGPYHALPPERYFRIADTKLHSEIGAPAIPVLESVRAMMPASAVWPQSLEWGLHDFCLHGAQGGASFHSRVNEGYGGADEAAAWIMLAHFITYDAYRAMFEAQGKDRMGVLLWMSHPCWPSFVWQTYDFYFAPTAAYFACKKAAEPLHIQWNSLEETVQVVNCSAGDQRGLTATLEVLALDGSTVARQTVVIDAPEDSHTIAFATRYPPNVPDVQILRLTLARGEAELSHNVYLRGRERGNHLAIRQLKPARVLSTVTAKRDGDVWGLVVVLRNASAYPALMVQMSVVRERSGDRILPVIFDDNFVIALMPGESRAYTAEVRHADTRGERPTLALDGFNLQHEGTGGDHIASRTTPRHAQ